MDTIEDVLIYCTLLLARKTDLELTVAAKRFWKVGFNKTVGLHLQQRGMDKWDSAGRKYVAGKVDEIAKEAVRRAKKAKRRRINEDDLKDAIGRVVSQSRRSIKALAKKKPELGILAEWCRGW